MLHSPAKPDETISLPANFSSRAMAASYPHQIFTIFIRDDHFKLYGYPGSLQVHAILGHSTPHSQYPSMTWNELGVEGIWLDVFHPDLARICRMYDVIHDLSMKSDEDLTKFCASTFASTTFGGSGQFLT